MLVLLVEVVVIAAIKVTALCASAIRKTSSMPMKLRRKGSLMFSQGSWSRYVGFYQFLWGKGSRFFLDSTPPLQLVVYNLLLTCPSSSRKTTSNWKILSKQSRNPMLTDYPENCPHWGSHIVNCSSNKIKIRPSHSRLKNHRHHLPEMATQTRPPPVS